MSSHIPFIYPSYLLLIFPSFHLNSLLMSSFLPQYSSHFLLLLISTISLPQSFLYPRLLLGLSSSSTRHRVRVPKTQFNVWPSGRDHYSQPVILRDQPFYGHHMGFNSLELKHVRMVSADASLKRAQSIFGYEKTNSMGNFLVAEPMAIDDVA